MFAHPTSGLIRNPITQPATASAGIAAYIAVGETVILLHLPLPLVGVSAETMRQCQQNGSLADGYI